MFFAPFFVPFCAGALLFVRLGCRFCSFCCLLSSSARRRCSSLLFFRQTDSFRFIWPAALLAATAAGFFRSGYTTASCFWLPADNPGPGRVASSLPSLVICQDQGKQTDQPDNNEHHRAHEFFSPALLCSLQTAIQI